MASSIKINYIGKDELQKALLDKAKLQGIKDVVRKNGAGLETKMKQKADFKKGFQTGTTKRSIGLEIIDDGLTAEVGATTEYSPYLEYGTRFMEAQSFVKPALNAQKGKFINDMKKIVR